MVPQRKRATTDEVDQRLAHAFEASQDLFFLATPLEGLEFALRLLEELVPSEAMSGILYDIDTDEFRFVALSGPGADAKRGEAVPRTTGLLGIAALQHVALVVEDVTTDSRFDPGVDGRVGIDAKQMLYMPLSHQGRLLGMLQLVNRKSKPGYSRPDANVVAYLAEHLAKFLNEQRVSVKRRH
jgi:GAF domain-containing protein